MIFLDFKKAFDTIDMIDNNNQKNSLLIFNSQWTMIFLDFEKALNTIDVIDNNDQKELFYIYVYSP